MRKAVILQIIVLAASCIGTMAFADKKASKTSGEAKFNELCAMCHPGGGNVMNQKKTLSKKDRAANNLKTEADIVNYMRKPGPGMTPFDAKTLSDEDAEEIAEYVMKAFK